MTDDHPDSEQNPPDEPETPSSQDDASASQRARLLFAGVLGLALVGVVVVVLIVGADDSDSPDVEPAPTACVESWNDSRRAVAFGVHNSRAHSYTDVQVTYLTKQAGPADAEAGMCAVIFGRSTLDPEPGASGQVLLPNDQWLPISVRLGVDDAKLQKLQVDALQAANAELEEDGTIVAVES
jgi:hypothetical protein